MVVFLFFPAHTYLNKNCIVRIEMQHLVSQASKVLLKQKIRLDKRQGNELSEIVIIQNAIDEMQMRAKDLEAEIDKDEGTYLLVAKSKIERKLKQGVSAQLAIRHQNSIDLTNSKSENKKAELEYKIESLEKQLEIAKKDCAIKIEKIENTIKALEKATEGTLGYYQPLLDRCYEEQVPDVAYPPSHYKKKETLQNINISIAAQQNLVLVMKAANFDAGPLIDPQEEMMKKQREQSRREALELQRDADDKEREQMMREAIQRKKVRDDEEKRVETRRAERSQEVIKVANSTVQVKTRYVADYDSEGEPLSPEEQKARDLQVEKDWSEPLVWPPPSRVSSKNRETRNP